MDCLTDTIGGESAIEYDKLYEDVEQEGQMKLYCIRYKVLVCIIVMYLYNNTIILYGYMTYACTDISRIFEFPARRRGWLCLIMVMICSASTLDDGYSINRTYSWYYYYSIVCTEYLYDSTNTTIIHSTLRIHPILIFVFLPSPWRLIHG